MNYTPVVFRCGRCGSSVRTSYPGTPDNSPAGRRYAEDAIRREAASLGWTLAPQTRCPACQESTSS